jgi:hypothetical protein
VAGSIQIELPNALKVFHWLYSLCALSYFAWGATVLIVRLRLDNPAAPLVDYNPNLDFL